MGCPSFKSPSPPRPCGIPSKRCSVHPALQRWRLLRLSLELLEPVQPLTKLFELRPQFLFYFRRHSSCPRKVPEHVGIALLRFRKGTFGVFPVAHAVRRFGKGGEREAHSQVRPDEFK